MDKFIRKWRESTDSHFNATEVKGRPNIGNPDIESKSEQSGAKIAGKTVNLRMADNKSKNGQLGLRNPGKGNTSTLRESENINTTNIESKSEQSAAKIAGKPVNLRMADNKSKNGQLGLRNPGKGNTSTLRESENINTTNIESKSEQSAAKIAGKPVNLRMADNKSKNGQLGLRNPGKGNTSTLRESENINTTNIESKSEQSAAKIAGKPVNLRMADNKSKNGQLGLRNPGKGNTSTLRESENINTTNIESKSEQSAAKIAGKPVNLRMADNKSKNGQLGLRNPGKGNTSTLRESENIDTTNIESKSGRFAAKSAGKKTNLRTSIESTESSLSQDNNLPRNLRIGDNTAGEEITLPNSNSEVDSVGTEVSLAESSLLSKNNSISTMEPKKPSKTRKFSPEWAKRFSWLLHKDSKVFCSVCATAYNEMKIKRPEGITHERVFDCFVKDGFSSWSKAVDRFKKHEKSNLHMMAVTSISFKKSTNVSNMLSSQTAKDRQDARLCLIKFFESIQFLAIQGLPIRGHHEHQSNLIQLLHLRATDQPLLKAWMARSKYRWVSHDVLDEMLNMMAMHVRRVLLSEIHNQPFYAIMADETTDVSRKEQMSINFRYVDDNLEIHESFLGFYETPSTTSATLYSVLIDALTRFNLSLNKCRGQCYDGAFNMSGDITGLQKRIRGIEPRAYYVHCAGHNLNLTAQDAMKLIDEIADFLSVMRELISFIRASAKRVHIFKEIQSQVSGSEDEDELQEGEEATSLKAFCPTRWTVRVKSLKSVKDNYKNILKFCEIVGEEKNDCGIKARGYAEYLRKFDTFIILNISIITLEKVEALNETIQATSINFRSVLRRVKLLSTSLNQIRTDIKFQQLYHDTKASSEALNLDEPVLPRRRVAPKRFDNNTNTYYFPTSVEEKYRILYYNLIDTITSSLASRFDSETYEILGKMEDFAMNKCSIDDIKCHIIFNNNDKVECDFDLDRLIIHRAMFFDIISKDKTAVIDGLTSISIYLQKHKETREFLTEYVKFIRLLLTSPQTVVIAERSFSALKRLKNYMQSTTKQQRTNDSAIMHVHRDISSGIDLSKIVDEFIIKNTVRQNTFSLSTELM